MKRRIPACTGAAFLLRAGQTLRVIDPEGGQVADVFCADAANVADTLSAGRSIDYNETVALTAGHVLYAHSGVPLLEIAEDTCGTHDFLVTPCNRDMFERFAGIRGRDGCDENLSRAFAVLGMGEVRLGTTFNAFMNVPVGEDGEIRVAAPRSKAGDAIAFVARRDVLVGVTACADEGSNGGRCKPIDVELPGLSLDGSPARGEEVE